MTGTSSYPDSKTAPGEILELFKGGYLSVAETIAALDDLIPTPAQGSEDPDLETTRALHDFANDYRKQEEIIEELGDRIKARDAQLFDLERQLRAAQAAAQPVCDLCDAPLMCAACGHEQRPAHAQRPMDRDEIAKRISFAHLGDDREWKGFRSHADRFLAYALPSTNCPPLNKKTRCNACNLLEPCGDPNCPNAATSTLRQCPICARRVASPCETLAIATSCPLSSTNGNTP